LILRATILHETGERLHLYFRESTLDVFIEVTISSISALDIVERAAAGRPDIERNLGPWSV
jgi:hypothetical protein